MNIVNYKLIAICGIRYTHRGTISLITVFKLWETHFHVTDFFTDTHTFINRAVSFYDGIQQFKISDIQHFCFLSWHNTALMLKFY